MRFAAGSLATAAVLFTAGGLGVVGAWALPLSAVWLLMAAVVGAVAMEERDLETSERLLPSSVRRTQAETATDPWVEAA